MKNKRMMSAAMAVLMAGSLAACGGSTTASSTADSTASSTASSAEAASESSDAPVTIRITWWGSQSRHDYTQQLLDLYTSEHPNITFEAVPSGWDGYFEKLATDTATGSMPDIVQMDYLYVSTYAANNSLADLTPYMQDGTIQTDDLDANLMASGNIGGKQIAMPLSNSLLAFGYSPAELEKAGVEAPTNDWTWDDFIADCQAVHDATGDYGTTTFPVGDTNLFNYWVRQHGVNLFAADNKSLGYDDDAITADWFSMWQDMMDKGLAPDPDAYSQMSTLGLEGDPIATDTTGYKQNWNNLTNLMANVNSNLEMVTPPLLDSANENKGLWLKPGMFFSVAETSNVKKECAEFIDWFLHSEEANDIIMGERGVPSSSTIRDYLINSGKLTDAQKKMFAYVDDAAAYCGDTPDPDPVGISEVNQTFQDCAYQVFYGQTDAATAAADFREQANSILAANN